MSWNTKFADLKLRATLWLQKNRVEGHDYQGHFLCDTFSEHAMMCSLPESVGDRLVTSIIKYGPRSALYQLYGDPVAWDAEESGYSVSEFAPGVEVPSRRLQWFGFDNEPRILVER